MIRRIPRFDDGKESDVFDIAFRELMTDEGFLANPTWDPIGKVWTSGYGFTDPKHQHSWNKQDALKILRQYIIDKDRTARSNSAWGQSYQAMSPQMQAEIINLMFLGGDGVIDKKMPKFRKALIDRDWNEATKQLDYGIGQTTTRSRRRQSNFGNAVSMMNIGKPEQEATPITSTPVVEQLPTRQYNFSQPVLDAIYNANLNSKSQINSPYYSPGPAHATRTMLPDLKTLIERQIFQPQWTVR